ncbi:MAG: alpha/beta hydrolase [Proteobacteria bacterium]|nr:alpha/beta hydrolase [Pseudomonadota bacterium]
MAKAPLMEKALGKLLNLSGFESRVVGAKHRRLHVFVGEGSGSLPPIMLVHGIGASASSFGPLMHLLRSSFSKIIVPDFPGHGQSAPIPNLKGHEQLFSETCASLTEFIREPIYLFGNSMGGAFSVYWAEHYRELTRGLVLCSPAGAPMDKRELDAFRSQFDLSTLAKARNFAGKLTHTMPAPAAWLLALSLREVFATKTVRTLLANLTPGDGLHPDELARLDMPVMFLWGKSEHLMPEAHFNYFAAHLPGHVYITRPERFGHCPQLDRPAELARYIVDFSSNATQAKVRGAA